MEFQDALSKNSSLSCVTGDVTHELNYKIAVLMCTFNGAAYIEEQLESILHQDIENIDIWISDDGSTDRTIMLLEQYKKKWWKGSFTILNGPKKGFASNFLSLACNGQIRADYYAYSDQDDIWMQSKLSTALKMLISIDDSQIQLYCSRTELIDENGRNLKRFSPLFSKPPSFKNALVQSLAGGNTMVFNQSAKNIIEEANIRQTVSHDWWTYILVTGSGGKVIYDACPRILYRQHSANQIGASSNLRARFLRIQMLLDGKFLDWTEKNIRGLHSTIEILTKENQEVLSKFIKMRNSNLFVRFMLFINLGIYRQSRLSQVALIFALLIRKL